MSYLISIYAWVIGGLYFLTICFVCIFLSYFVPQKALDPWIKRMLKGLFKIILVRVRVEGYEKIDPEKNYLFMSNHVSLFDIPLLGAYIPTFVRGVEAKRQFKWPIYGWVIRRIGNIPIDRKNIHSSIRSMRKTEKLLRKGRSIVVLPEGHRTLDGKLRPFKKLPFFLAKQAFIPIVPIGLSGLFRLKSKGSWIIRPTTVKMKFGDIINLNTIQALSVTELRDYTREKIQDLTAEGESTL